MVHGSWFMVHGSWFMVHGSWFMVHGSAKPILADALQVRNSPPASRNQELRTKN
jgi:hypothetical protein